jgi:nucleoside-diphosphate-sugar epimerase
VVISAAATGVARLVVVTSAMTYGASPGNAVPLPEDAPLAADPDEGQVGDLLSVEQILRAAAEVHAGLAITVVRPAALVGPHIDTVITRHFEAPRLLTVKGGCPAWQFCHVEDLATALVTIVELGLGPVVTVASDGWMTQAEVEVVSGMRRVELSESVALGTAQRLHRVGLLPAPASDLAYAVYPWAVSSATLAAAGWRAAYDNVTCLGVLLDSIRGHHAVAALRVERKDAALGAASAAVALVGTAAIMRRRRRKGSGA